MTLDRRKFIFRASQAGLAGMIGVGLAEQSPASPTKRVNKPNIVFILVDDLGYSDASCLGSDLYETPYIDRFRREGMYFSHNYAASTVCAPTRASILTGKYPARLGINAVTWSRRNIESHRLLEPKSPRYLHTDHISIAKALNAAGYMTACIGKWQLDGNGCSDCSPRDHGFKYICEERTGSSPKDDPKNIKYYTRETINFIKQNKDKPFYIYLSHDAMHHDYEADDELVDRYRAKIRPGLTHDNPLYAANLEHLDNGIGELVDEIDRMGLRDNTLIMITSDNGGRTGKVHNVIATSNYPLKHGKHTLYEGGIRVPLFVRWPGKVKANSICEVPVHSIDFFPTFTGLAGSPGNSYDIVDGVNISGLFTGKNEIQNRSLFWYYPRYLDGPFWWGSKTICMNTRPCAAVRQGDYKLLHWFEDDSYAELYDVKKDPAEKTNLSEIMPDKVKQLRTQLYKWLKDMDAKLPVPNPDYKG